MLTRREVVRSGMVAAGALGLAPAFWRSARAASAPVKPGPGPYGPLQPADANGIMLPKGFSSRVIAQGRVPVASTGYTWHLFSDGAATFATPDGGWILVCNSEIDPRAGGGASAIRFAADGSIGDAYRVLGDTSTNCAGGKTPWGTWMSCEEHDDGAVWECDPTGTRPAVRHPAMGLFSHEAVAVDPVGQRLYLTEDQADSGFYRFTPEAYPDCSKGHLEVAIVAGDDRVTWVPLPNAQGGAGQPTRKQVPNMTQFKRGEGIAYDAGVVYVSTTSDHKVHAYDTQAQRITVVYDAAAVGEPPLHTPDNITVAPSGDIFVGEDSGDDDPLDLGIITPEGEVARFLKFTGTHHGIGGDAMSEVTGPCFDPSGTRLYVSSQRAYVVGVVYEITGPFRLARVPGAPLGKAPALPAPGPGSALAVEVARRRKRSQLLRSGLPVALTLDKAADVKITVRARIGRRGRSVVLARLALRLGAGPEQLRVRLSKTGRRRVRAHRGRLRLTVEVSVGKRVVRRTTTVT